MFGQRGFTLLETLLALALTGILGVSIPSALSGANRATIVSSEHTMAESLARSQMEYIQNQTYDYLHNPPVYSALTTLPTGYTIAITTARLDPAGDGTGDDDSLQKITINVSRGAKLVFTLIDYKVNTNP